MVADTSRSSLRDLSRLLRPLAWRRPPLEWWLLGVSVALLGGIHLAQLRVSAQPPVASLTLIPILASAWLGSRRTFGAVAALTGLLELALAAQSALPWGVAASRCVVLVALGGLARVAAVGYAGTRGAAARLALVSRVARIAASSSSLEDILREVLDDMARDGLRGGTICLIDEHDRLYVAAAHGDHLSDSVRRLRLEMGQGIMGRVAQTGESMLVPDIDAPGQVQPAYRSVGTNARMRSLVSVPLVAAGTVIGVLSVDASRPRSFTQDDVAVLEQIALAIAGSVQRAGALQLADRKLQQRITELTLLLDTASRLAQSLELDVVLREVVRSTASAVSHGGETLRARASFYRIDEHGVARLVAVEDDESHARIDTDFPLDEHPYMQDALHTGRLVTGPLDTAHGIGERTLERAQAVGIRRGAWIRIASGAAVHGVLVASTRDDRDFDAEELRLLEGIAHLAGLAVGNAHALRLERERAEAAGEHARRMAEVERVKSEFLRLASHELRGPLAVLGGYLSMMEEGTAPPEQLRRIHTVLLAKVGEMNRLVDQMLETARLEDGRLQLERQSVDLSSLLEEAVRATLPMGPPPRHSLVVEKNGAVPVQVDPGRIVTVLANLVSNAVKYSPDGGEVRCSVLAGDEGVQVRVSDHGIGIDAADLPRLFTRFGRVVTPQNSHIAGTGLGLYLSRELARMHGGDITVESEPGRGSAFTLFLPRSDAHVFRPAVEQ